MPELPEVETIRRDLQKFLAHKTIQDVIVPDPTALTGIGPSGKPRRKVEIAEFRKNIIGKQIEVFQRRGKYLVMEFTDGDSLIFHLRMTGQLLIQEPATPPPFPPSSHPPTSGGGKRWGARVVFFFNQEKPRPSPSHSQESEVVGIGKLLCFIDRRRFGEILFSRNWKEEAAIRNLGIEPLNGTLSGEFLNKEFKNRTCAVHSALLNQKIVSGLGNIYATDALFLAGIRPTRKAGKIPLAQLEKLTETIKKVLKKSIQCRGYSMNTYVDALGKKGRSQLFSLAYGKDGQPCPRCKSLMRRRVISGRGTVFCPKCQK